MTEESLKSWIEKNGFIGIEANANVYDNKAIEFESIEEFFSYSAHIDKKILFYKYEYEKKNDYVANDEHIEDLMEDQDPELHNAIKLKINNYKEQVKTINFSRATSLTMFFIDNGFMFYHVNFDNYFEENEFYPFGEELVKNYADDVFVELSDVELDIYHENKEKRLAKNLTTIKNDILNHPEFKESTNPSGRKMFCNRYIKNNPKFARMLREQQIYIHVLVDNLWKEYKASLKK